MEVLTKLRSTVSSTVSQLSGVLPGNPVTREFEVCRHVGSAGPGLLWKIFSAYKKSTRQEAAVFVFEKKQLERYARHDRDFILDALKKGVSQLTRLRHPKILTVQHPLEESRESLAFATEPVFASLANALGHHENAPSPLPADLKDFKLFEIEIKYGILQMCDGLAFLHNDVKLLHRNVCPEAIIINKCGAWKIAGFEFCVSNSRPSDQQPFWSFMEWEHDIHHNAQPNLSYLAPEYALTLTCGPPSDMYSLGALMYSVFNHGKSLFSECSSFSTFKTNASELKSLTASKLECVPAEVREHVRLLLHATPELRPDAHQLSKVPFFDDVGAKTLEYLDSLFQWDNLQKSQFYKGLPQVISQLPKRVNLYRVVPCLIKEFVSAEMVPFVLPSVLLIAEGANKEEYCDAILPHLKPVFKIQEPIQILLIFMQKMELLLSLTPPTDIKNHVLPMVYRALEADAHQIQELCLNVLPSYASLIDYPSMKNALLPRIKKLCLSTPYLSVRVNCLVCIGKLLDHLDKWLVLDEVLPLLPEIPSREPAILMGILGIYKLAMDHKKLGITKDIMANHVLPFLMPLSIENGLTLQQFNAMISIIKEMVARVENEHRAKLEQLNNLQQEQRSALQMTNIQPGSKSELLPGFSNKPMSEMDKMFEGLGLGNYVQHRDAVQTAAEMFPSEKSKPSSTMAPTATASFLSLEEKERLAKQQEQQQRLKRQPSLQKTSILQSSETAAKPVAMPTTRDLTDTLINANLSGMSLPQAGPAIPPLAMSGSPWASRPGLNSVGNTNYGFQSSGVGVSSGWSIGTTAPAPIGQPIGNQSTSMDSLLPPPRSKQSLNQLASQRHVTPASMGNPPMLIRPAMFPTIQPIQPFQGLTSVIPASQTAQVQSQSYLNSDLSDLLG